MGAACPASSAATASVTAAVPSMPILTASTRTSAKIACSCAVTKAGGISSIPVTPRVFCAVSAVSTAMP